VARAEAAMVSMGLIGVLHRGREAAPNPLKGGDRKCPVRDARRRIGLLRCRGRAQVCVPG